MSVAFAWSITPDNTTEGLGAKVAVSGTAVGSQTSLYARLFGGYTPGEPLTVMVDVRTQQTASGGTPDTATTDGFESYANTAALHAVWPLSGLGGEASVLNITDAIDGSKCAEISVSGHHQQALLSHTFTTADDGIVPNAYYTATIKAKRLSTDTHGEFILKCGGAYQAPASKVAADNGVHTLTAIGRADGSGNLLIQAGFWVGFAWYPNDLPGNLWKGIVDSFQLDGPGIGPTEPPLTLGLDVDGGAAAAVPVDVDLDLATVTTLAVEAVADGSGEITPRIGVFGTESGSTYDRPINTFDNLRICHSVLAPPGPDPNPPPGGYPPPPIGGARPFGIHNISVAGFGFWNSTVQALTPSNILALLAASTAAGAMDLFRFGGDATWLDGSGRFSLALWKHQQDLITGDPVLMAAMEAAIAASCPEPAWGRYLIDEPFHPRWGGISLATLDEMAAYSKAAFPTWRTILRVRPTDSRLVRPIVNVDTYWAEYKLSNGDVTAFREDNIAAVEAMGVDIGLILGIHYGGFDSGQADRNITPAELRHYGGILASSPSARVVAMGGWKFSDAMYAQAGFPDAVKYLRDLFASLD